jgi:hypothetical protein
MPGDPPQCRHKSVGRRVFLGGDIWLGSRFTPDGVVAEVHGRIQQRPSSNCGSTATEQVNNKDHQPYDQEQVDQASADMQAETQEPQDQKNNKNCP